MRLRFVLCLALPGLVFGCVGTDQPYVTEQRLDEGLVLVLTGMHGRLWLTENIAVGLDRAETDQAVKMYDWTQMGVLFPLLNLRAEDRNREAAAGIAEFVREYKREYPGRPVTLVGYSAGGPMAIWTAEALSPQRELEGIIVLASPLQPDYDLRPALAASRKGVVSFHSRHDWLYLGLGTIIFGTMDGGRGVSAGNVGFEPPEPDADGYDHLFQVPWQSDMAKLGYMGTHLTIGAPRFVAAYLAPLIESDEWDQELISEMIEAGRPSGGQ